MSRKIYMAILWLVLSGLAGTTTIYVTTNGVDTRTGQIDWTNAVLTISNGVARATTLNDLVLVSNGVYLLTAQITVSSQITVRSWNNGVVDSTNTIVNGNAGTRCFNISHTGAVVEGFTIYNGTTNANGGGVSMTAGTLRNCLVISNSIPKYYGGGVYVAGVGTLVDNCTIAYNNATNGGGVYVSGGLVTNCVIRNNSASSTEGAVGGGGGVRIDGSGSILANCSVYWNEAVAGSEGGGIMLYNGSVAKNCVISNNFARAGVGAGVSIANALITNCVIITNIGNGQGAGIALSGGTVANCQIIGNQQTNKTGSYTYCGGGISGDNGSKVFNSVIQGNYSGYHGGGVYANNNYLGIQLTMRNCLIIGNVAIVYGGGIFTRDNGGITYSGPDVVENCTIVSNSSTSSAGGGFYTETSDASRRLFANCIIYFNTASTAGSSNYYGTASFSNCCFSPVLTGVGTNYSTNNITSDPQFADKDAGNWRLKKDSPCVNTGVNRDWMTNTLDLSNHRRVDRITGRVDMGCYEYIYNGTMFKIP